MGKSRKITLPTFTCAGCGETTEIPLTDKVYGIEGDPYCWPCLRKAVKWAVAQALKAGTE